MSRVYTGKFELATKRGYYFCFLAKRIMEYQRKVKERNLDGEKDQRVEGTYNKRP